MLRTGFGAALVGVAALVCGCTSGAEGGASGGKTGASGGTTGSGGSTATGGATSSGGATGSGGAVQTGGATGSGGAPATGGTMAASGGSPGSGGSASGGTSAGGSTSSGGMGVGGASPSGGRGGDKGSGGAGGSSSEGGGKGGWVSILPTDDKLTGWIPLIKPEPVGMDQYKTFRRNADGYLVVTYADYPNGSFDNHFGLLYYDKVLTNYRVRVEYRFQEPQAKSPPSWGKNNSGIMVFCTDPRKVTGNPDFPPSIEIQLAGNPSAGGSVNCQLCLNGSNMYATMVLNQKVTGPGGCFKSSQASADFQPAANWVTVEADVQGAGTTSVYQHPDTTKAIMTFSGVTLGSQKLTSGYLSLQSESQPIQFRKIELMDLSQ